MHVLLAQQNETTFNLVTKFTYNVPLLWHVYYFHLWFHWYCLKTLRFKSSVWLLYFLTQLHKRIAKITKLLAGFNFIITLHKTPFYDGWKISRAQSVQFARNASHKSGSVSVHTVMWHWRHAHNWVLCNIKICSVDAVHCLSVYAWW